ncbi:MAG: GDSL-type esterase/lipase family protein [Butyricicoccus sp.]|nr:GDSL-type esterase/lipase family protein [Butyricicoccus sp.]
MKRRRLIALFLALALALALSVPASAADAERWAYCSQPYLRVSRLEFIGLLAESLFPGRGEWALGRPELTRALGLSDRELASREFLTGEITRQEAARYLANALRLKGVDTHMENKRKTGIDAVSPEYGRDVLTACAAGLLVFGADGRFNPEWGLHRNEAAELLRRFDGAAAGGFVFENFLFLGDSLTSNPHYESNIFQKNGHQVFAGGGAVVRNFLGLTTKRVTVGYVGAMTGTLKDREFNGIVILLGANDVGKDEPEDTMVTYRKLLDELQEFCDKPIFVLRVFPINSGYAYGNREIRKEHADALNELLREYCEETDGIWFADPTGPFTDEDGNLLKEKGTADGLHISSLYYEEFYEAIESALYGTGVLRRPE